MNNPTHIFYYSRKKLGLYLLFNILLLTLAVLFTLTIFPDYPPAYYFALGSCGISVVAALLVFICPMHLAVITPQSIKIDRGQPLEWQNILSVRKVKISTGIFGKKILKFNVKKLTNYHMNFMQKITADSKFGAFSIPLYAMDKKSAREIETLIRRFQNAQKPKPKSNKKKPISAKKQ